MTESIVIIRLKRNLRYKLTYIQIFEAYLESRLPQEMVELLQALIQAQQSAIAPLSSYLRRLEAETQDLELDDRLMEHALGRQDVKSRLWFIRDGLERATSWYKMQLVDKQMTSDPELKQLLYELGEIDAAKLWTVEAVMGILRIPEKVKEKDWDNPARQDDDPKAQWQSRLMEDFRRPNWGGRRSSDWYRPSKDWRNH